jgi:hypothetical protein
MHQPSSDDGTMEPVAGRADTTTSVIVANNRVTLTPVNETSYFYSMFGCLQATGIYGGIAMTISAPAETVFTLEYQTSAACSTDNQNLTVINIANSTSLGWVFDGTEKAYSIPFSGFPGLDTDHLVSILFGGFEEPVTFGPMQFYCGQTPTVYLPPTTTITEPTATDPVTVGPTAFVIDTFADPDTNDLGFWHGGDDNTTYTLESNLLTINMKGNSDNGWYSQLSSNCSDYSADDMSYLHIVLNGSTAFSIALQQHNPTCDSDINPSPYTWDSVEASRYATAAGTDIYVPLSHFVMDKTKTIGLGFKAFYTSAPSVFSLIEMVRTVPADFAVPSKVPTAPLIFACTRPNSFAFAIDDGEPGLAQQVIEIVKAANISVTFFTVGAALLDHSTVSSV